MEEALNLGSIIFIIVFHLLSYEQP